MVRIGKMLKVARADAELSQKKAEAKSGIKQNTISRIEIGKVEPNYKTVQTLANTYGYELRIVKKEGTCKLT